MGRELPTTEEQRFKLAHNFTFSYGVLVQLLAVVVGNHRMLPEVPNGIIRLMGGSIFGLVLRLVSQRAIASGAVIAWSAGWFLPISF